MMSNVSWYNIVVIGGHGCNHKARDATLFTHAR